MTAISSSRAGLAPVMGNTVQTSRAGETARAGQAAFFRTALAQETKTQVAVPSLAPVQAPVRVEVARIEPVKVDASRLEALKAEAATAPRYLRPGSLLDIRV